MKRIIINEINSFDVFDSEFSCISSFLDFLRLRGLLDPLYSVRIDNCDSKGGED